MPYIDVSYPVWHPHRPKVTGVAPPPIPTTPPATETTIAKEYKKYLSVTYTESQKKMGVIPLCIKDIITGEVLANNSLVISADILDSFESYAERLYADMYPIVLKDPSIITNKVIDTYEIDMEHLLYMEKILVAMLSRYVNDIQLLERDIQKVTKEYLSYWAELQICIYKTRKDIEDVTKALKEIEAIKMNKEGCYTLGYNVLQNTKCHIFNSYALSSTDNYTKFNYPFSGAINQGDTRSPIDIRFPSSNTLTYAKDVIKFIVKKPNIQPKDINVNIENLSPNLKLLKEDFKTAVNNIDIPNERVGLLFFKDIEPLSIFKYLYKGKISTSTYTRLFVSFNKLKNQYMLLGMEEEQATKHSIDTYKKLSDSPHWREFDRCLVTKQYLPKIFLSAYKNGYISTVYALMHSPVGSSNGEGKYTLHEDTVVDMTISGQKEHEMSVFGHDRNVMQYLSVRKHPTENTTITCKDSLFTPTPFMGIELEIEQQNTVKYQIGNKELFAPEDISAQVYDCIGRDYVILKRDGSLRGHNPFEVVTVPATLAYHKDRFKVFLQNKEIKKYLTSYSSGNCGMHIHINRNSFTGLHLAKFMKFINCKENMEFVTCVAQRSNNKYAQFIQDLKSTGGFAKYFRGNPDSFSKYFAVNTRPSDTIEVRIFRGNLATVGFLKNLEFVHAVWAFTKDAPLTSLNFKEFIFWLFNPKNNTKDYKEFKMWLLASGWNVDGVVIRKTDTGLPRVRKEERRKQIINARKLIKKRFENTNSKLPEELKITKDEIISAA